MPALEEYDTADSPALPLALKMMPPSFPRHLSVGSAAGGEVAGKEGETGGQAPLTS